MSDQVSATVDRKRFYNPFAELSHANGVLLANAKEQHDGWLYECMTSILISAFSFEAFLNLVGERLFPFWSDVERPLQLMTKLKIVLQRTGVNPDFGARPYQTLTALLRFRNSLAHPKPEWLVETGVKEEGSLEQMRRTKPPVEWEANCTLAFAERVHEDVAAIATDLWRAAGLPDDELHMRGHGYSIRAS